MDMTVQMHQPIPSVLGDSKCKMDAGVQKSKVASRFRPAPGRCNLITMSDVTTTPPALRWVALFLAACAVLGLFLGFRDQIRKNPPGWYTGAEQVAVPLSSTPDGAREAVPFDPSAQRAASPSDAPPQRAAEAPATTPAVDATDPAVDATSTAETPAPKTVAPPVLTPTPAPKLRPAPAAPRTPPPSDPVGDILEGQKQTETPAQVPY